MSESAVTGGRPAPALLPAALAGFVALALLALSIALPGGPLAVAIVLLAGRRAVRRRSELAARVVLAVALLAVLVQLALVVSYGVSGGGDEGTPVRVPATHVDRP